MQLTFPAHDAGTVSFWNSARRSFGARTWKGAMRAFAKQHGRAVAMLADDSALIIDATGKESPVHASAVRWVTP